MSNRQARLLIDFRLLRQQVSLRQLLNHLSYRPTIVRGNQWRGHCPLHDPQGVGDRRCFSAHLSRNGYRCFECQSAGNVLAFWMTYRGLPIYPAACDLCAALQLEIPVIRNSQIQALGTTPSATHGPR